MNLPYRYDLFASICFVLILILGNLIDKGTNPILKIIGVSLLVLSIILWIIPVFTLKKHGQVQKGNAYFDTHEVVKTGIYSLIKHPQYLSYMLLVSGFAFIYQNWIIYFIAALAIVLFYIHSIEEEKEMLIKYPQKYKAYCENVPRFNIMKSIFRR